MPDLLGRALLAIDASAERMLDELAGLVRIDTSMPPGRGYEALVNHLETRLSALGFSNQRVVVPETLWHSTDLPLEGPRINLVSRRDSGREPLSLYGHMDVVPADAGRWNDDPLELRVEGGFAYGRGTSDMKGALASLLVALRAATESGLELLYDPVLLFCTDEEGGTYPGIRHLAEQGYVEGHLLCMDGHAAPRIWAGCCGLADFHITVLGESGHSGAAEAGRNAIEAAVPIMTALLQLKAEVESRESAMREAPGASTERVTARLNITVASGGTKATSVPGKFDLFVDRRYLPEESFKDVQRELEAIVAGSASATCPTSVELIAHLPPVEDPTGPHWPRWQAAMTTGFGFDSQAFSTYGAGSSSDMGWVQAVGTKEILLGGVGRSDNHIHGPDERVAVQDLLGFARSLLCYLAADFEPERRSNAEGET